MNEREQVRIGVIGGSGLYDVAGLTDRQEVSLTTPFGDPSAPYVIGALDGQRVAFLVRVAPQARSRPRPHLVFQVLVQRAHVRGGMWDSRGGVGPRWTDALYLRVIRFRNPRSRTT